MKNNRTTLLFWISLALFLVALGGVIFFIRFIAEKNGETARLIETLETNMKNFENRTELEKKIAEAETIHSRISGYFVDADRIDMFVDQVESLGIQTGTTVVIKSADGIPDKPNILALKISFTGTFSSAMNMLSLFESLPYDISISNIYMNKDKSPNADTKSQWQFDIVCTIKTT